MDFLPNDIEFSGLILGFLVVLMFSMIALLISIHRVLSKWINSLQKSEVAGADKIKHDALVKATAMLDDARRKSMGMISEVSTKVQSTIASINKFSKESTAKLTKALESASQNRSEEIKSASDELLESYKDTLSKQKQESTQTLIDASHKMEEDLIREVDEFKDILHKETIGTKKEVEARLQKEYTEVEGELNSYRERQLKAIDQTIFDILHDVSKQVFGEALSMEEHQELVIKALSEAKAKNVLAKE